MSARRRPNRRAPVGTAGGPRSPPRGCAGRPGGGAYRGDVDADAVLDGLDAAQADAVLNPHGPLAILAPAGAGKTRVLTRRIARRVADGSVDAAHVLVLTFTRAAASEVVGRLNALGLR